MGGQLKACVWCGVLISWCVLAVHGQPTNAPTISLPRCTALPRPVQMHACVVIGQRVYVMGGDATPQGWSNKVYSAEVTAQGCLGKWRPERDLPEYRSYIGTSTEVVNSRIYVVAGESAEKSDTPEKQTKRARDVLWSSVQADGSLGEWKRGVPFGDVAVTCAATCTTERNLYLVGGQASSRISDTILMADLAADGEPGNWREAGKLPTPLWFHGAAILDERMYVWGGLVTKQRDSVNARVFSAPVGADGKIDAWRDETPMPYPVYVGGFCGFNDFLVAVSGQYSGGYPTNTIWYARIDKGRVGQWQLVKTDLEARVYHGLGLDRARGTVFITGGQKKTMPGLVENPVLLDVVQAFRMPQPQTTRLDLSGLVGGSAQVKTSLEAAIVESKATKKNVLAFFYAPEVPACRRLYDNVLSTPAFGQMLGKRVLALVDTSKSDQSQWCYKYSVFKVPALVEIAPDGKVVGSAMRLATMDDVKAFLARP